MLALRVWEWSESEHERIRERQNRELEHERHTSTNSQSLSISQFYRLNRLQPVVHVENTIENAWTGQKSKIEF